MDISITSVHNSRVKIWSELLTNRGRNRHGRFLLEGVHLTEEALTSDVQVEAILYSLDKGFPASLEPLMTAGIERVGVSEAVLARCSDTQTPQGVASVAVKPSSSPEKLWDTPEPLVVAVDGVQDPGNLGTIIRTADASGATGVVLGKGTVDLYNPKTVRSTMGSLFHLPVVEGDLTELLAQAKDRGIQVLGAGMEATVTCYDADWTKPTCLVVGNEGSGLSPEVRRLIGRQIAIPMPGRAESLNVAMATGVLLYEALRQRRYSSEE